MNFFKKYTRLFVLIFFVSKIVVASESEVVASSVSLIENLEILKLYQQACTCPKTLESSVFQVIIEKAFFELVKKQDVHQRLVQDFRKDQRFINLDFADQLQKKLEEQIEIFNSVDLSPCNLKPLPDYKNDLAGIRRMNSVNNKLLTFASHLFASLPPKTTKLLVQDNRIGDGVLEIYTNIKKCLVKIDPLMLELNADHNREKVNIFLSIFQELLNSGELRNLYELIETEEQYRSSYGFLETLKLVPMYVFKKNEKEEEDFLKKISYAYGTQIEKEKLKSLHKQYLLRQEKLEKERLLADELKRNDPRVQFEQRVKDWQESYQEVNKEWNIHYDNAIQVLNSEILHFEIQLREYQEFLENLKKMNTESNKKHQELLDLEQKKFSTLLTNFGNEYLQCQQKIEKRKEKIRLQNISGTADQILQDCKCLLEEYENRMKICQQEFIAKLDEDQILENVCNRNKLISETIEHHKKRRIQNALKLEQKDLLWTKIHEDGKQIIAEFEALDFDEIAENEKKEKDGAKSQEKDNHERRGFVLQTLQKFVMQQKMKKEKIRAIEEEKKETQQFGQSLMEQILFAVGNKIVTQQPSPCPLQVQAATSTRDTPQGRSKSRINLERKQPVPVLPLDVDPHFPPLSNVGVEVPVTAVPGQRVIIPQVHQPEQGVVSVVHQNNLCPALPVPLSLSNVERFPRDQRLVSSAEFVPVWFVCADGFKLKYCGNDDWAQNDWAQDEEGYWYVYNSITNHWDAYENPLPPTYEKTTSETVMVDLSLLQ